MLACRIARLRAELAKLALPGWSLVAREVMKGDFRATKVDVEIDESAHRHHRSLRDILEILERSTLEASVRERAARIFTRLADAEARVHGADRESVRFHDVGAVDAIVDVTGGVIALDLAGAQAVHVSALPMGGGFVQGPHGRIPVPGPGTAELLRGFPVVDTGVKAELVTPTGAAILTTLAASAGRMPALTIEAVGYGAGTKDLPGTPNVLRCFLGQTTENDAADETVLQVETTIDDMSPQLYETLIERVFDAGALDVFLQPVIMKRGRPGVVVTALCVPEKRRRPVPCAVRRDDDDRRALVGVAPGSPAARDGRGDDGLRDDSVQSLAPGRPNRDRHARVRGRRPYRPREVAAGARGSRPGSRRRTPPPGLVRQTPVPVDTPGGEVLPSVAPDRGRPGPALKPPNPGG